MIIRTKFDAGDRVHVVDDGELVEGVVSEIHVVSRGTQPEIQYAVDTQEYRHILNEEDVHP